MRRVVIALLVAGCASMSSAEPLRVEFLATGYLVDNTVLVSPAELQSYLADQRVRQVRLVSSPAATAGRVTEATAVAHAAGASIVPSP